MINQVVVSSRVRLARNFEDLFFPTKLTREQAKYVVKSVTQSICEIDEFNLYKTNTNSIDNLILKEEFLISEDLLNNNFGGALVNKDKTVSIMLNEEDHIRLQVILPNNNINKAYLMAKEIDGKLNNDFNLAYDNELGYLTSCPTNLGTGMRISQMLFLPGLTNQGYMGDVINKLSNCGVVVRGCYGEGSNPIGYLYQISNKSTLGMSEQEIIELVTNSVKNVVELELNSRKELLKTERIDLTDKCRRAYGILTNSYKISSEECMQLLGEVKFGYYLGILSIPNFLKIDNLEFETKPAHLSAISGKCLNDLERKIFRSEYIQKTLNRG